MSMLDLTHSAISEIIRSLDRYAGNLQLTKAIMGNSRYSWNIIRIEYAFEFVILDKFSGIWIHMYNPNGIRKVSYYEEHTIKDFFVYEPFDSDYIDEINDLIYSLALL